MISNLIVVDENFVTADGSPKRYADMHQHHCRCHPELVEQFREGLMETFNPEFPPIFVTADEWHTMLDFMEKLRSTCNSAEEGLRYQEWWNKILERARKEAQEYAEKKNNCSGSESEGSPTSAINVPEIK